MSATDHDTASETASTKKKKGRRAALIAVILIALLGLAWLGWWFLHRHLVSTDDAYVEADIAQIAPRVTGTVAKVFVRDNEHVAAGDVLFTLDPADYQTDLARAEANLEAARASYAASQRDLSVTKKTSSADIDNTKAALESARAEAQRARADAKRYETLYAKHEVSEQSLDQRRTQASQAEAQVRQARAQLAQAQASPDRIELKASQASQAEAQIAQAKAQLTQARLNLSYTEVRAPHDGKIAQKTVVPGSHVSAGQAAMAVVENAPWVVANFKETQLDRVRIGQPVSMEIDAYPGREFDGRVESIQAGTGVTFSLLPPQNATGNFVKIVQRVPVKIVFTDPDQLRGLDISPGLSVVPTINTAGDIEPIDRSDTEGTEVATPPAAAREALHNLSRVAFESSQTVQQGVQAQRLPDWQVKPGNAAAASVRPNRLAAGALRALDRRQCSLPCNEHATLSLPCQSRAKHPARPRQVVQSFPRDGAAS